MQFESGIKLTGQDFIEGVPKVKRMIKLNLKF
jgi:hypothetical protein